MKSFKVMLLLALCIAFSSFSHAANDPAYKYRVDLTGERGKALVTPEVCGTVGDVTGLIKVMMDRGMSNQEITKRLAASAARNLDDHAGWVAYNLVGSTAMVDTIRTWSSKPAYHEFRITSPGHTAQYYHEVYGSAICNELLGTETSIIQVYKTKR